MTQTEFNNLAFLIFTWDRMDSVDIEQLSRLAENKDD